MVLNSSYLGNQLEYSVEIFDIASQIAIEYLVKKSAKNKNGHPGRYFKFG